MRLPNVNWPTAALLGGLTLIVISVVHRPTAEWFIGWVTTLAGVIADAFGG